MDLSRDRRDHAAARVAARRHGLRRAALHRANTSCGLRRPPSRTCAHREQHLPTALESLFGFALGNGAAVAVATLFVANRYLRLTYFPIVLFFNTIPILALAPIVVLIFGLGMFPKVVVAAIVCFFPTLVNMIRGLESVTTTELDIVHSLCATKLQILLHLRFPRSVPYLFAALRIAAQTSVIGALVGEWIGTNKGLGALIIESTFNYHAERLYAAVFVSSLLAICFFAILSARTTL